MATGCRRLAGILRQEWPQGLRRLQPRHPRWMKENHSVCVSRVPVVCTSAAATSQPQRWCSTKLEGTSLGSMNEEEEEEEEIEQPPGFFTRLWRWLHTNEDALMEYQMSEEERRERDELMAKVQELYFADPPQEPDLDFCKDTIRMLIKYNDKLGVDTLWNIFPEMKVEPDEELTYMVKTFLAECRRRELAE